MSRSSFPTNVEFFFQARSNTVFGVIDDTTKEVLYCCEHPQDAVRYCQSRTSAGYPCYIKQLDIVPTSTTIKICQLVAKYEEEQDLVFQILKRTEIDGPLLFQTPSRIGPDNDEIID